MASNEEGDRTAPRGNEWEVVSLSGSAYAAAPGPEQINSSHDNQGSLGGDYEIEVSNPMFMSGHFVFPPSQHENLPVEPEYNETNDEFDIPPSVADEGGKTATADFEEDAVFNKERSISTSAEFQSFNSGPTNTAVEGDISLQQENASDSGFLNFEETAEAENYDCSDLPCEAWWKRRALTLYTQAKETNTFWSLFVAAAVMGLVIIGHRWQQERWQILHLKWQSGVYDTKMRWMFGPISRAKNVIVGGYQRGSFVQGSTST